MHRPGAVLTQIDFVEVGFEDFLLGVAGIQDDGHDDFVDLAPPRPLGGEVKILDELLGQGAAALDDATRPHIDKYGSQDAAQRNAVMLIELVILAGEQRIQQGLGRLIQLDEHAILALRGIEAADLWRLHAQQRHGFAGVHILQQDRLPIGELGSQFASGFQFVGKLEFPRLEHNFVAQTDVAALGRQLGVPPVHQVSEQPLKVVGAIGGAHEQLRRTGIDAGGQGPALAFELLADQSVLITDIGHEAGEDEGREQEQKTPDVTEQGDSAALPGQDRSGALRSHRTRV